MDLFDWGLRIGPSNGWVRFLIPTTELQWTDISSIKRKVGRVRIDWATPDGRSVHFVTLTGIPRLFFETWGRHGFDVDS